MTFLKVTGILYVLDELNPRNYQNVLAFIFAVNEINRNPHLLPNISLGFRIVDGCSCEERAVTGMFDILSGGNTPVPNFHCGFLHNLAAIVDGISSKVTILLAQLLGISKIPQISYSTLDPVLSDKVRFPSFYRTVPSDIMQYLAIVQLVKYFSWSWVGILVSDDESGLKMSQLNKYMKQVRFTNTAGAKVYFDEHGDMPLEFDILNWIVYPNETLNGIIVGSFAYQNGFFNLKMNESLIRWSTAFNQTPQSACSETCTTGYRKTPKAGYPACCYDCIPCPEGAISNQTDMELCFQCQENQWPNTKGNACVFKEIIYLSYGEPLGMSLALISILFFLLTSLTLLIFTIYRSTAIVKANNRDLSYLLLLSLKTCFLCNFIFMGHPIHMTCILRQTVFGVTFSISLSTILAKTVTVIIAFHATKPRTRLRTFLGPYVAYFIVIFCSLIQVLISASWLGTYPPFPQYNMVDEVGKIIAECNEGSKLGFYSVLGFMGLLACISFIIAFFARNLPDNFNEAKLITFSMLVFCSVWVSFIPAYMSTKGKYVVATEIFAIIASSMALLVCIFIPKCYIILLRPERNTKVCIRN
ncbi:vomeronasal type-2 receptor 26 [Xenopus tropicalis]|uniref:Vomeronasal type-2 receptor 26 n=1 Tax=Xenopus tropicalis TaxID=8364 RepID=A0A8J1ISC0_XENTR|nr:vomeronasal type-2 receptor 26 [Xenopus tropicalis]